MTYSCAFFSRDGSSLESAQTAKLELTCQKLRLQPGQRVLDVGCGWGSFAIHAGTHHGVSVVGITLSERQAQLALERVNAAGLSDRVRIRVLDYRDLDQPSFDAIASIGMVEHVGEARIDEYARRLAGLLRPGGRLLNHGIAHLHDSYHGVGDFTDRYVFPDADPLHLSRVILALERAGFMIEHVEEFGADYAQTLSHWIQRLDQHHEEAVRLAGEERVRIWQLYLRGARRSFETRFDSIYQVKAVRR
jgi:cyclopropane-fatty-acyl-phospholipid synthase